MFGGSFIGPSVPWEALSRQRLGLYAGLIVIVNLNGFYDPLVAQLSLAVQQRFVEARHLDSLQVVTTVAEALTALSTVQVSPR